MPAPKGNQYALGNKGGTGRPSPYRRYMADQAYERCLLGSTDAELADYFEVNEDTIHQWKHTHKDFFRAIRKGKEEADAKVAKKLYHKALGAEWVEQQAFKVKKVFYDENGKKNELEEVVTIDVKRVAPPETQAIALWLRNRQSGKWSRDQNVEVNHTGTVMHLTADLPRLCGLIAELAARRTDIEIQGDVSNRPLLPAEIRAE